MQRMGDDAVDVTVTEDSLPVYQDRDLTSTVIAQVPRGHGIKTRLDVAKDRVGREWMEANLPDGRVGYILATSARGHTTFGLMYKRCLYCGQIIKSAALRCRFCERALDTTLRAQEFQEAEAAAIRAYLRKSGVGLVIVAGIQFALSAYLSAVWGGVCLGLGVLNLAFPRRGMLITNGVAMLLVGIGNFAGTLSSGQPGMMTYLGVMQVIWGFKELRRYSTGDVKK
jgi:hypothetical protein